MFTFIDLFAGIGGMRKAFESAGGECVFTSEIDKFAQKTYKANFLAHDVHGDIREIESEDIPSHDVLLAGFPCQPFSAAGLKHGFMCQTQGTLFFEIARILEHHRPKAFLLENVKNLVGHDRGRTYNVICKTLSELGYQLSCRVIDARFWVPQHRERIFIAGFRRNLISEQCVRLLYLIDVPKDRPLLVSVLHGCNEISESPYTLGSPAVVNDKYTLNGQDMVMSQVACAQAQVAWTWFWIWTCWIW